jgi:cardiolipin synthase
MLTFHLSFFDLALISILYVIGFFFAINATFQSRTPQGTMAWVLALICIPFFSVPIYLLFGKNKIEDYDYYEKYLIDYRKKIENAVLEYKIIKDMPPIKRFFVHTNHDFISGNSLRLLLDGLETFEEMILTIKSAKKYILLQMYIFRTDLIGSEFAAALEEKAREGVKVYVLYERLGIRMSKKILKRMQLAGVCLGEFSPIRLNKLQLNFRNHRKLLIIDGQYGFFGGINIGDDYLGRYPEIGFWRDTNIKISGPIVSLAQIDFIKDWKFSQSHEINIELQSPLAKGSSHVLLLNSGPSEEIPLNLLLHIEIINSAQRRLWMANPYFIPPQGILDALLIANMRGVDIRVLVPRNTDNYFVALAMEVYLERMVLAGIRVFKYAAGMMHQKVILLDESLAVIGSSNLDFRSMYINFENTVITDDTEFIKDLDLALRCDFDKSVEIYSTDFKLYSFRYRLAIHLANSLAPIL